MPVCRMGCIPLCRRSLAPKTASVTFHVPCAFLEQSLGPNLPAPISLHAPCAGRCTAQNRCNPGPRWPGLPHSGQGRPRNHLNLTPAPFGVLPTGYDGLAVVHAAQRERRWPCSGRSWVLERCLDPTGPRFGLASTFRHPKGKRYAIVGPKWGFCHNGAQPRGAWLVVAHRNRSFVARFSSIEFVSGSRPLLPQVTVYWCWQVS